jgi:hypothetical protein
MMIKEALKKPSPFGGWVRVFLFRALGRPHGKIPGLIRASLKAGVAE